MTSREFYELVKLMREYQRRYFSNRNNRQALDTARRLETAVDAEISRVEGILLHQQGEHYQYFNAEPKQFIQGL